MLTTTAGWLLWLSALLTPRWRAVPLACSMRTGLQRPGQPACQRHDRALAAGLTSPQTRRQPTPPPHVHPPPAQAPASKEAAELVERCKDAGLLLGRGGLASNALRIKPPMCITKLDIDFMLGVLDQSLTGL